MDGEEEDATLVGTVGLQQDTEGLVRTTDAAAGGGAKEPHASPLRSATRHLQFSDQTPSALWVMGVEAELLHE